MEITNEKTDLRVKKTLTALTCALEELLKEKDLDAITVKEICDKAQTRKATFYNHFTDKNDLFSYMILKIMHSSEEAGLVPDDPDKPADYLTGIFKYLMDFSQNNEAMTKRMLNGSGSSVISDLYSAQMQPIITDHLKKLPQNENPAISSPELLSSFITGAILEGAKYWFYHRDSLSKKEAADQFCRMINPLFGI